jgi:DNA-binding SARP family transcriptional activator
LTARENNVSFVPSASKSRKVLSLLTVNANRVVPIYTLQKELWGDTPPRSALTTLQTYILQLRKLLGAALADDPRAAKDVLVTQPTGYLLQARDSDIDVHDYQRLATQGQQALAAGDHRRASQLLADALCVWQGPALVDVQAGLVLEVHAIRLEESRTTVLEQRIEADLRLGRHHQVTSELHALVAEHTFNENLHAQLMTALHRSGRRGEALAVYHSLRQSMIDELGLDLSPRLQRLQQSILSCDPELDNLSAVPA